MQSEKPPKRKSRTNSGRPVLIDLSDSPPSTSDESTPSPPRGKMLKSELTRDYKTFRLLLDKFENNSCCPQENEIEKLKLYLADWIASTSRDVMNDEDPDASECVLLDDDVSIVVQPQRSHPSSSSGIRPRDVRVFRNYLMYLLSVRNDLETLSVCVRILKRLAYKHGSPEWIALSQELVSTVQSEFYIKYDHTLEI